MFFDKVPQAKFDQVTRELSEVTSLNLQLEAKIEDYKNTIESLGMEKQKQIKLAKTHQAELDKLTEKHTLEMSALKNSVNKQINSSLASIGVNQFASEIYSDQSQKSDKELLNKLNSLPQEQKTEFYNAHKVELTRALLAKN